MKCYVQGVYLNVRYRILNIENEKYILDMGGSSLWRLLFPFLYWLLPLRAYHVDNDRAIDELIVGTTPKSDKSGFSGILGGAIAVILGNALYPLIKFLGLEISSLISALIMTVIFILLIVLYIYINNLFGKKLHKQIDLRQLTEKKVWVRPQSMAFIVQFSLFYLFWLALSIGFITAVIQLPNGFMFFASSMVLFMVMLMGFFTIKHGDKTTVRFKK